MADATFIRGSSPQTTGKLRDMGDGTHAEVIAVGASGGTTAALSQSVTLATDDPQIGTKVTASPALGTGGTGLIGWLSNAVDKLIAIGAQLPASLGAKTAAASLSVTPASDAVTTVAGAAAAGVAPATNPVSVSGVDGGGLKRHLLTDTSGNVQVVGSVASGAADSGNPVKIGAKYSSSFPTYTDGQRGDLMMNQTGHLLGSVASSTTSSDGITNTSTEALLVCNSLTGTGRHLGVYPYDFNGASWDRKAKASNVSRIASAANTTNATVAKASAGTLHQLDAYNNTASLKFLKFYNKASGLAVGTDTPVLTIVIPANSGVSRSWPSGLYFSAGISYALTGAVGDADTTALTAGDVLGVNLSYA